ncbi:hypothetical protein LP420_33620 [Massilia sp. B-10]|nr:hypothetical protein LP420_33620 [Massilia sp. B-10]
MFSLLGVLFGMPLPEVLKPLSMSEEVSNAVLDYKGELGDLLRLCEAVELGDFDYLAARLSVLDIDEASFDDALVEANRWMLGALRGSQSSSALTVLPQLNRHVFAHDCLLVESAGRAHP